MPLRTVTECADLRAARRELPLRPATNRLRRLIRTLSSLVLSAGLLAGCSIIPDARPPVTRAPPTTSPTTSPTTPASIPSGVANAALMALVAGPSVAQLPLTREDAAAGLRSFRESCNFAVRRTDASGLTRTSDWKVPCAAAQNYSGDPRVFFRANFDAVKVGDGTAYATGYFEPQIRGSRKRRAGYDTPVYALPDDLIRQWPADMPAAERSGRPPLGRINDNGQFVPYFDRTEIEQGALAGRGLEIAWIADPVEFFFLQIQGSGRLITPEGDVIRIGYAGQNGLAYTGIGGLMRQRGLLGNGPGQYSGSMQGIMAYIREHPERGQALMRENRSWIFFRELTGDGPLGSLGVPVRRESSVAVDPKFVPYGAPVWLNLDRDVADGLWVAQDTGGAIRGANRFDTFWGAGEGARQIAGGMSGRGQALILLPKAAAARLTRR